MIITVDNENQRFSSLQQQLKKFFGTIITILIADRVIEHIYWNMFFEDIKKKIKKVLK